MPRLPDCRIVGKELTFVFPSNGDALVGYRMIREAVDAAEKVAQHAPATKPALQLRVGAYCRRSDGMTDCPHCGAPHPACWWSETTGDMSEGAPCAGGDIDPDRLREDRPGMRRVISIAQDFSRYPAGRYCADGPYPGETFRDDILYPALAEGPVDLVIDGVSGLPSSFLEEAMGGLVRRGMTVSTLRERLNIVAHTRQMKNYIPQAWKYVEDAVAADGLAARDERRRLEKEDGE